ncbi:hypothetical protein ACUXCC_001218 [Cytobacillus horneckiae]|uniref:hypothetical protein n=1 Tax=Cytobacillus horneckiae TaxID=549687 RepID=UPI0019D25882|nr:hypothetical protein [Cytobacillus horneckiae]MBN6886535.1 hypothetical protein [Cytobacillus horneckiae]
MKRLKPLFEQLLSALNVNIEIEYRIILIHPNLFLYQFDYDLENELYKKFAEIKERQPARQST